jgi:hypothetical protein
VLSPVLLELLLLPSLLRADAGWLEDRRLLLRAASSHSVLCLLCRTLLPPLGAATAAMSGLSSTLRLFLRDRCVLVC